MDQIHPFNWNLENPNAVKYGDYYWGILLNDGRYIYAHADKVLVTDTGDVMLMRNNTKSETSFMEPYLVLAKGHWVSFFAANILNGSPVSLDNSVEYTEN